MILMPPEELIGFKEGRSRLDYALRLSSGEQEQPPNSIYIVERVDETGQWDCSWVNVASQEEVVEILAATGRD